MFGVFFLSRVEIISSWKRENKLNLYFLLNRFFFLCKQLNINMLWVKKQDSFWRVPRHWGDLGTAKPEYLRLLCVHPAPSGKADNPSWDIYTACRQGKNWCIQTGAAKIWAVSRSQLAQAVSCAVLVGMHMNSCHNNSFSHLVENLLPLWDKYLMWINFYLTPSLSHPSILW